MSLLNPVVTCGYVNTVCYVVNNRFFSAHGLLSTCILAVFFFLFFLCILCICAPVLYHLVVRYDTIAYEMLFNVRSKANMSQLNLPHGTDN